MLGIRIKTLRPFHMSHIHFVVWAQFSVFVVLISHNLFCWYSTMRLNNFILSINNHLFSLDFVDKVFWLNHHIDEFSSLIVGKGTPIFSRMLCKKVCYHAKRNYYKYSIKSNVTQQIVLILKAWIGCQLVFRNLDVWVWHKSREHVKN